jgi:hypothetical protein
LGNEILSSDPVRILPNLASLARNLVDFISCSNSTLCVAFEFGFTLLNRTLQIRNVLFNRISCRVRSRFLLRVSS